jgi:hypothetical protein
MKKDILTDQLQTETTSTSINITLLSNPGYRKLYICAREEEGKQGAKIETTLTTTTELQWWRRSRVHGLGFGETRMRRWPRRDGKWQLLYDLRRYDVLRMAYNDFPLPTEPVNRAKQDCQVSMTLPVLEKHIRKKPPP